MGIKDSFSEVEWRTLQFSPIWIFVAVAGADNKLEKKEFELFGRELHNALGCSSRLAREVLTSVALDTVNIFVDFRVDNRGIQRGLQNVADILEAKMDPGESLRFKLAIFQIGVHVAEACGSGLFRSKICDEEKAALYLISKALRLDI